MSMGIAIAQLVECRTHDQEVVNPFQGMEGIHYFLVMSSTPWCCDFVHATLISLLITGSTQENRPSMTEKLLTGA